MLDGWYCRSMANEAAAAEEEEQANEESKCKKQYKFLKRKFRHLIYENEAFRVALRAAQKRLLTVTRDRNFLLDRLLQHEKIDSSSESDETESSDDQDAVRVEPLKKRRIETGNGSSSYSKVLSSVKRKRPTVARPVKQQLNHPMIPVPISSSNLSDGHMTPEEVERHLQSRQSYMELVPERAPLTVPTEMFSNEPSLDSESNHDLGDLETSPSNIGEELSIDMIPE
ncbi:INO80 complex subunit E isoform X2 [Photinus pyralis]|uniref:INO80 complex subunit E N-terminal domain-containing protein n=1 Tax=Photinus pyralis TaxID=7054 RepID=A0A1Y1MEM7_PHOPY|nr:INO80 complex subunit E isoform X2 [Photinus pyralis]